MSKAKVYYQTTPLNDFELAEKIAAANAQTDKIMLYMQNKAPQEFSAWDLQKHFDKIPITSLRRSLNTLEAKSLVIHAGFKKGGEYGETIGYYRAAAPSEIKTEPDDDMLIPENLAAKRIGTQILKLWINQNKITHTGKRPRKFRQKDLNKVIMSEFMSDKSQKPSSE